MSVMHQVGFTRRKLTPMVATDWRTDVETPPSDQIADVTRNGIEIVLEFYQKYI
jgi:hypothetical protein